MLNHLERVNENINSARAGSLSLSLSHTHTHTCTNWSTHLNEYACHTSYTTGPILEPETETSDIPVVHQFWTKVPYSVVLPASESTQTWRFLTALSTDLNDALAEYESAINSGTSELQQEHITVRNFNEE